VAAIVHGCNRIFSAKIKTQGAKSSQVEFARFFGSFWNLQTGVLKAILDLFATLHSM
jgi:hypothetical protein